MARRFTAHPACSLSRIENRRSVQRDPAKESEIASILKSGKETPQARLESKKREAKGLKPERSKALEQFIA
eukprot:5016660-Amphidinium_carterae.2